MHKCHCSMLKRELLTYRYSIVIQDSLEGNIPIYISLRCDLAFNATTPERRGCSIKLSLFLSLSSLCHRNFFLRSLLLFFLFNHGTNQPVPYFPLSSSRLPSHVAHSQNSIFYSLSLHTFLFTFIYTTSCIANAFRT